MSEKEIKQEKKLQEKPQVGVIGIPHTGTFPWQTAMSLLSLQFPPNTIVKYHLIGSCLIYDSRKRIIEFAINEKADWLLFVDSDMVLPPDCLMKFANSKLEGKQLDLVGGMCFKRTPPFQPCFYTKARIDTKTKKPILESPVDFPPEGLLEVEGIGMACTFIRKNVWEKILVKHNDPFFPYPGVGEDLSFCIRARMEKINMFVDLSVNVGHMSNMDIRKEHFIMSRDNHFKNNPNDPLFKEVT